MVSEFSEDTVNGVDHAPPSVMPKSPLATMVWDWMPGPVR